MRCRKKSPRTTILNFWSQYFRGFNPVIFQITVCHSLYSDVKIRAAREISRTTEVIDKAQLVNKAQTEFVRVESVSCISFINVLIKIYKSS